MKYETIIDLAGQNDMTNFYASPTLISIVELKQKNNKI